MARQYLKGLPQLQRKLQRLRTETEPFIRGAMEAAAEEICDMMRRLVPVSSGALQDSIGWTWGAAPKRAISMRHTIGIMTITIYAGSSEAFYARWVEFGTAPHENEGRFRGSEHPGTIAQPFFYPAYRAQKRSVRLSIRRAINQAVREATR